MLVPSFVWSCVDAEGSLFGTTKFSREAVSYLSGSLA
jgi:hypothetical protein